MTAAFQQYVSFGVNCETAFQMRRVLGRDSASFFSWNVTRFRALLSLLDSDFGGILQRDNLSYDPKSGLIHDTSHDYWLHSPFAADEPWTGAVFEEKLTQLRGKMAYLAEKFRRNASSGARTVYFYRTEEREDLRRNAAALRDCLRKWHGGVGSFVLVVLQHEKYREPSWREAGMFNRYLTRCAPWSDASDGHVRSWDAVFAEFPHQEPLRLAGFNKAAASPSFLAA